MSLRAGAPIRLDRTACRAAIAVARVTVIAGLTGIDLQVAAAGSDHRKLIGTALQVSATGFEAGDPFRLASGQSTGQCFAVGIDRAIEEIHPAGRDDRETIEVESSCPRVEASDLGVNSVLGPYRHGQRFAVPADIPLQV